LMMKQKNSDAGVFQWLNLENHLKTQVVLN
jgi:hypothetical protein